MDLRVWQYLDPNLDDPNEPFEPVEPTFSDVNLTAASFKTLTQNKKKIYKFLILQHTRSETKYTQTLFNILAIRTFIYKTLPVNVYIYIKSHVFVHAIFVSFQQEFKPTDIVKELKVTKRY